MRRIGSAAATVSLLLQTGCYNWHPTGGVTPAAGTRVALSVNDAGRYVLGSVMGPGIDRVEGVLLQKDSSEYVLSVTAIRTIRGDDQQWGGEKVHLKSEFVTGVYERRLSKEQSLIAGAIGVGALVFILTRAIQGAGSTDPDKVPGDSAQTARRHR